MGYKVICDKCSVEANVSTSLGLPEDWVKGKLILRRTNCYTQDGVELQLCPDCADKTGLKFEKLTDEDRQSNLDKLWDIMIKLAEEAAGEV